MQRPYPVAIDVGTTCCKVAVKYNENIDIVANDQGNRTTPAYVAFVPDESERLTGDSAKNQASRNPNHTIYNVLRLIGRKFSDPQFQLEIKNLPFKVEGGPDDKPLIVVEYKGGIKRYSPMDILAMILETMKQHAEAYLGKTVTDAVVTVPAYFNHYQRDVVLNAGIIAHLNVIRIYNQAVAAAYAYQQLLTNEVKEKNVLVFDAGGGTTEATILKITSTSIEVKATACNSRLGGNDIDNKIVEFCAAEFMKKHGIDLKINYRAMRRLRNMCERSKRTLSATNQTCIEIDSLMDGIDFVLNINRGTLENLVSDELRGMIDVVRQVLAVARMETKQIDDIILIGGSSRTPRLQSLLSELFDGKTLNRSINPDEAAAYGAAVQAAILTKQSEEKNHEIIEEAQNTLPVSIAIETAEGGSKTIFEKGVQLPSQKRLEVPYSLPSRPMEYNDSPLMILHMNKFGNQPHEPIKLPLCCCSSIKSSTSMMQAGKQEKEQKCALCQEKKDGIEVSVDIDENYILTLSAQDKSTGKMQSVSASLLKYQSLN